MNTDLEYRQTDGGVGTGRATGVIESLSGHELFGDGWRIGFASQLAQVNAQQVQGVNGLTRPFSGTLGRAEIYLQHDELDGKVVVASLLSNGNTVGAGVRGELPDDSGVTALRAEYIDRIGNFSRRSSIKQRETASRPPVGSSSVTTSPPGWRSD